MAELELEIPQFLIANRFDGLRRIPFSASRTLRSVFLATTETDASRQSVERAIHLLHFSPVAEIGMRIKTGLEKLGWEISEHEYPFNETEFDGTILILG